MTAKFKTANIFVGAGITKTTKFNARQYFCVYGTYIYIHTYIYSKTSNGGPSEKRTTSVQRTTHLPPIDFTIELIHYDPLRSGHL